MISSKKTALWVFIFWGAAVWGMGLVLCPDTRAQEADTGILLADDHGRVIHGQNIEKPFVPASILKILTSYAAITRLGENFCFSTNYYFDDVSKNLYIKGFGDPLFISEVIEQFCRDIILTVKTRQIHDIILDQTFFSDQVEIPGKGRSLNPYDAPVGALCANFNTLMFKWNPQSETYISAEPQTPLLDIFHKDIKQAHLKQGRIILTKKQSLFYPGLLMTYFFKQHSVQVIGSVKMGIFPVSAGKIYLFKSPFKMTDIVQKLLQYSNNFIANQLFLSIGARTYHPPATLEKGVNAFKQFIRQNLNPEQVTLLEGSGLSRANRISPEQMLTLLLKFKPYYFLLNRQENEFYKTGTLSGVRTRAGYILGEDKRLYPFVIMVNRKNTGYGSIRKDLLKIVSQTGKGLN